MSLLLLVLLGLCAAAYAFTFWQTRRSENSFPPQGEFVGAKGARVHLTRREPAYPPRATVVLIHGASGNQADMMAPLGDRLAAAGFRVIAVDRPGQGYSPRPANTDCSPAAQAAIVRGALERCGVAHAIVVGHSLAGAATVNLLLDHADFCDGAVLIAPVTHPWPGGIRWYYKLATTPGLGWLFANLVVTPVGLLLMTPAISDVFAPQAPPPAYSDRTGVALALRPDAFRANARDVVTLRAYLEGQAPRMRGIDRPVAIVSGDRDAVVLTECHSFGSARDIPGAQLTMMAGVGHSPHWVDPDAIVGAVERVVARSVGARNAA